MTDGACRGFDVGGGDGLYGVDDDDAGGDGAGGFEDGVEVGFAEDEEIVGESAYAVGSQFELLCAFFAGYI